MGRVPVPVDDNEMSAIRAATISGLPVEPWLGLKIGEQLHLESGPLAGVDGVLVGVRNSYRLVLSVTLLNRSIAVEIDRDWVKPFPPIQFKAFQPAGSTSLAASLR
jgi:transcription antitermination factor NusG